MYSPKPSIFLPQLPMDFFLPFMQNGAYLAMLLPVGVLMLLF